jgi:hypothetical protein
MKSGISFHLKAFFPKANHQKRKMTTNLTLLDVGGDVTCWTCPQTFIKNSVMSVSSTDSLSQ